MLIFDPVARLKLVTTWIYLTYLMYKYKYTYLHTHPPNFNSYTYSCMHMGKQLFNFYLYIDIYLQACLYMYLHTLTYVTCKHLTVIEHYLSSAMSLLWYMKYLIFEDEGIRSISPVLTEKRPSMPKAYLKHFSVIYICMYTPLKDSKTSPCILFYLGWAAPLGNGEYVIPKLMSAKLSVFYEYVCHSYPSTLPKQSYSR